MTMIEEGGYWCIFITDTEKFSMKRIMCVVQMKRISLLGLCIMVLILVVVYIWGYDYSNKDGAYCSDCKRDCVEEGVNWSIPRCNESKLLLINGEYTICYRCDYVNWSWVCPV